MPLKRKRRLTDAELKELRKIMDSAPQGRKPSVRFFARYFGVNQPSIIKSLGGWDGVHRNKPDPSKMKVRIDRLLSPPVKIEPFTTKVEGDPTNVNG